MKARAPFQPAPITMPIEASSSSACTIAKRVLAGRPGRRGSLRQYFWKASASDDDGVIGYQAHDRGAAVDAAERRGGCCRR